MGSRAKIVVKGRVQGVGFRWFVQREAEKLQVTGYVRNLPNGDVEAEFEGDRSKVENLISKVRQGPTFSRVVDADVAWLDSEAGHQSFEVRF